MIFYSSDGVKFHVHQKYLQTHPCFAPAIFDDNGDAIPLLDAASTLELLFQFMYPRHHPELIDISFDDLVALAEAAENYEIYSAMVVCKIRMR